MKRGSWLTFLSLVLAYGSIYTLPYMRQTYHTTMLEAYSLTNTELGILQATFGLLALLCYLPGGRLADRFSLRGLLCLSLVLTALGGLALLVSRSWPVLVCVHAFWGVFTILTFWPALIKATRVWAGEGSQGSAFGLLQGFAALVLASVTGVGVATFAAYPVSAAGLRAVIGVYTLTNLLAALAVWFFCDLEGPDPEAERPTSEVGYLEVLRMPAVRLQAMVDLTAYLISSWGTADFAAYAEHAYGQTRLTGAALSNYSLWLNPLAAVAAGWLADRFGVSRVIQVGFLLTAGSLLVFALTPADAERAWFLWAGTTAISVAIFAVVGVYYALLEEGGVPLEVTGRAVGMVSIIGYTPDVFAPLVQGWLLDTFPGEPGHRLFYLMLVGAALLGLMAARAFPKTGHSRLDG